ncbi:MFS transporter [Nitratireductor sp. GCM10026969]|uniref:MFS transporter n=1 Tax=Nitratireductor sp. GCM10026969 TaxID=3252645 RepID=UPI00360E8CEA
MLFEVLRNPTYQRLFGAQIIALLGTGLLTVALGLLAFDAAGGEAGVVLGMVFFIKMVAYVGLSPLANAVVSRLPPRRVLVAMDLVRAAAALCLPFVDSIWQIYLLIFVLQGASATFTPTFQALIPEILPDERQYTRALSLSRLAYDLENLVSPVLAGLALLFVSYHWLFGGTTFGFLLSALLVISATLPHRERGQQAQPFLDRLSRGMRIYLATPRLRGLLSLNLAAASIGAMVIVNTVVIVRAGFGLGEPQVAMALGAFGAGSMTAALLLPRLLDRLDDRTVMLAGAAVVSTLFLGLSLGLGSFTRPGWGGFLALWLVIGFCYAVVLTPSGRLLRRSAQTADLSPVFAAHFALSHACWLVTYPLAGWLGARLGMAETALVLGLLAVAGVLTALFLWPVRGDKSVLEHVHTDLDPADPHIANAVRTPHGWRHAHVFNIDDRHRRWPSH